MEFSARKILFDHLPKCGGTTLNKYLINHYQKEKIFSVDNDNPIASINSFKNLPYAERCEYDLIIGHRSNQLIDHIHPESIIITVLRDPVDRLISHYYFAKSLPHHYLHSKIHESNMTLEDYVTSGLSEELQNWYTTHFSGLTIQEAEKNPEKSVDIAFETLKNKYDIIGFLDNFSEFIHTLKDTAKLTQKYLNERSNVTKNRSAVSETPQSSINLIKKTNYMDMALYKKIKDTFS